MCSYKPDYPHILKQEKPVSRDGSKQKSQFKKKNRKQEKTAKNKEQDKERYTKFKDLNGGTGIWNLI